MLATRHSVDSTHALGARRSMLEHLTLNAQHLGRSAYGLLRLVDLFIYLL